MAATTSTRDWSDHELKAAVSLVAALAVWAFLVMRMTDGGVPVDVPFGHLLWTYFSVVVGMIVTHSTIGIWIATRRAMQKRSGEPESDERDAAIELRAARVEGWVGLAGVNVLVIQAMAASAGAHWRTLGPALNTTSEVVFALLTLAFLAHAAKQVATLWLYRR